MFAWRGGALTSLWLAAIVLSSSHEARATSCEAGPLATTCINDDNLWPHAGPARFVSIGSTETVARGHVGFGLVTSYLSRPITLRLPSPGPAGSTAYAIDNQVNGTFLWALGITQRLELDVALPVTFGQGGTGLGPLTSSSAALQDTAIRDMRFGVMYALVPRDAGDPRAPTAKVWSLAARFEVSAPTGDEDQFAGERAAVFVPSLAADFRRGRWFAGLEVGARVRPTAEILGTRVGTQGIVAFGVGADILKREVLSAVLEARALPTFSSQATIDATPQGYVTSPTGAALIPAEWMLSARTAPLASSDLALQLGGGGPLTTSTPITTPRFRFALSVRYAPGARDTDGDGILDADDRCPTQPGPRPGGCPAEPPPPVTPVLGLGRAPDVCKVDPDTVDGFKDDDGCPDEDADKDGVDDRYDKCPLVSEDFAGLQEGCPEGKTPSGAPPAGNP
jgi:OOP family OmpA-OmpF porin